MTSKQHYGSFGDGSGLSIDRHGSHTFITGVYSSDVRIPREVTADDLDDLARFYRDHLGPGGSAARLARPSGPEAGKGQGPVAGPAPDAPEASGKAPEGRRPGVGPTGRAKGKGRAGGAGQGQGPEGEQ